MLSLLDTLTAAFIFVLFASLARKQASETVRFWMLGWLFVVIHFVAQLPHPGGVWQHALFCISFGTLPGCALGFIFALPEFRSEPRRQWIAGLAMGIPWAIGTCLTVEGFPATVPAAALSYTGSIAMIAVAWKYLRSHHVRFACVCALGLGCAVWLTAALRMHRPDYTVDTILTQCFGMTAILISFEGGRRLTMATFTITAGAISWAMVWVASDLMMHLFPHTVISPEAWNLPKYFVAAGMILQLLDQEIRIAKDASSRYRLLFAGNPHPLFMYDPATLLIREANQAALQYYRLDTVKLRSVRMTDLVEASGASGALTATLCTEQPLGVCGPHLHRRTDGSTFQAEMSIQPAVSQDGAPVMYALVHDVTERERLHAQLVHQSSHDVLTGAANRALFERTLEWQLDQAASTGRKVALFCIDLNRFKQINDTFGHAAGDHCLIHFVNVIRELLPLNSLLARTGGDEFMLVLGDLASSHEAEIFSLALEKAGPFTCISDGVPIELTMSTGYVLAPDQAASADELWRAADASMYRNKHLNTGHGHGRGPVRRPQRPVPGTLRQA